MAKTKAQKERHKRWLKKHPEKVIKHLEKWISKEKNPIELARAKRILENYLRPPAGQKKERKKTAATPEEIEKLKKELDKMSGAFKKIKEN
jgi:tRNA-dihydrouridine synthase